MNSQHTSPIQRKTIPIRGMHCRSCEILLSDALGSVPRVSRVDVSFRRGEANISYSGAEPDEREIARVVEDAGYAIGTDGAARFFSTNIEDYRDLLFALVLFFAAIFLFRVSGIENLVSSLPSSPSKLGVVFLIGAVAGVSTCLAVVGGLVLGVSARFAELHPNSSFFMRFRPHLLFHGGRIAAFVAGGALLGAIGSAFSLSSGVIGILFIAAAVAMALLGLKLIGIFPVVERFHFSLPSGIARAFGLGKARGEAYRDRDPIVLGALSFLLPCGFTQAMQVLAAASGSVLAGSLVMGVFALGTTPGLIGIGGVSALARGQAGRVFFRFSGVLVLFFATLTFGNAWRLFSLGGPTFESLDVFRRAETKTNGTVPAPIEEIPGVSLEEGKQVVRMRETGRGYVPEALTVKKGVPVRWVITAEAPYSCAASLIAPKIGIRRTLKSGENVVEFTPNESGTIPFSCSMGMYTGSFTVVE